MPTGNKLFSETQEHLWVVPSFYDVSRTHTHFNYQFGTNMVPDWTLGNNCSLKETAIYSVFCLLKV